MSDLISRKAVIDYLREQHDILTLEKNNPLTIIHPEALKGMNRSNEAFNNFMLGLPTAYDVDKVVERLGKESDDGWCFDTAIDINTAFKIVRRGGRDE